MLASYLSKAVFKLCHSNHLVYNTCWEDPRLDREALRLGPGDRLLVITSAGCNALDYALDGPERVDTVDINPRQNALLELKLSGIRRLDFDQFFELFGRGRTEHWDDYYNGRGLREEMSPSARKYWDKHGKFFNGAGRRPSFYFRGSSGMFAWSMNAYINRVARIRPQIERMLEATSIEEQREAYYSTVKPKFWGPLVKWTMKRDATLSLLGVPRAQRRQLERYYQGGITKFVEDRLDTVFGSLPLNDNYFWRVYLTGEYSPECCPSYLREKEFAKLKGGLVDRVKPHHASILSFLLETERKYSHYVLLDHMDWLAEHRKQVLERQWQAIIDRADDGARILWRSAAVKCEFVDPVQVQVAGQTKRLGDVLEYDRELAAKLHAKDRVNTYGSFSIANLRLTPPFAAATGNADERTGATEDAVSPDALAHSR